MTDHRDDELAHRLAELETPDHGPGFWAELRADLASSTKYGSDPDAHFVENDGVVALAERRDRRRTPQAWLVAAAIAVVALLSAGVVLTTGNGEGDADVATDPTVTDGPSTTTIAGPLRADGEPNQRGVGRPVAVDPTGTFLYVSAPGPGGGLGCEGAPAEALYVERVDGDGTDRRLAVPPDVVDATGLPLVAFSQTGRIAVVPRCEGFGSTVVTGTVADDGTVTDTIQRSLPDTESILDIEFTGLELLIAATSAPDGARRLLQFPASSGEPTDLGVDGVVALDTIEARRLVTASSDGSIRVEGRLVAEIMSPVDVAFGPSGATVVVTTAEPRLLVVDLETGSLTNTGLVPVPWLGLVVPDDGTVLFARDQGPAIVVTSLDVGRGDVQDLVATSTGQFAVTPDAGAVFVGRFSDGPAEPPALLEQRLTR